MSNTIQVNDKVVFNSEDFNSPCYRDCTAGKQYLVRHVGVRELGMPEPDAIAIIDDVGDEVIARYQHVTVVKG